MGSFVSQADALSYLGLPVKVGNEVVLLWALLGDGRLEAPIGFYRELSEVEPASGVESLALTLDPASVGVDEESVLSTVATFEDGSSASVDASYSSSDTSKATVLGSVATGVAAGTASITASFGGKTTSETLTVTA